MKLICTLLFLLLLCSVVAQQQNYTAFTTKDGLPSNNVYCCVEDNNGFLWVATDAGIARFDGKYFQVFTTEQGLPDNEVLYVVKEKDGTIWINCFKQAPAYFDEVKNRFINSKEDSDLAKVTGTANMQVFALPNGGVAYHNEMGTYIFRNRKLISFGSGRHLKEFADGSWLEWHRSLFGNTYKTYIFHISHEKKIDSIEIETGSSPFLLPAVDDKFYLCDGNKRKLLSYSDITIHPLRCRTDSIILPETFFYVFFANKNICLLSSTAKVYMYNKQNLQLQHVLQGNYLPNGCYDDSKGNLWLGTVDRGLLVYRKSRLTEVKIPPGFTGSNFISLTRKTDGNLLAGNYYGEIVEAGNNKFVVHTVVNKKPSRQRKILLSGADVYTISDAFDGIYVNYKTPLINPVLKTTFHGGKTGIVYNDTLILIGTTYGFLRLNTVHRKINSVVRYKRVTALAKPTNSWVYVGSTDGLHKYDPIQNRFISLTSKNELFRERISGLCVTDNNMLWMATANNGVAVLLNDSLLCHITQQQGIISNSCRTITNSQQGQVWLGTSQGISVIDYRLIKGKLSYTIRNLSQTDGLTSNEINEMVYHNDTVYAATGNGIAIIPVNTSFPLTDIPIRLIKIRINQRDTIISNIYSLNYQQQNITMQFAGIELNGHFKGMQYSIDDNDKWADLTDNTLTLQLNSGDHKIQLRAMDVNGNISSKVLAIYFNIAKPFWKAIWFWLLVVLTLQLITIYFVNRRQKKKKERNLARKLAVVQTASLEQQAFTSLMNPHFMFNALNSIQHYINVQDRRNANRYLSDFASLIRKNFEAAQQSFIPLEQELENLRIYLRLEQMRFTDKFSYDIRIDENIDTDNTMIPTMMLQPLLENAVLHGLMPSTIKGELTIDILSEAGKLLIIIIDNGIGIRNSTALRSSNSHNSHGMELIKKRLKALGNFTGEAVTIESYPAFESETNPGNKMILSIPQDLYTAWNKAQQLQ